jgi:branched-chain amino acid aminotransferase
METAVAFPIRKTSHSRLAEVNLANPGFGLVPTDHMFVAEYAGGEWREPRLEPFRDLTLSPFTLALHYGQTVFEGMKAFRQADGSIAIFRIDKHYERFGRSLERMCMAVPPYELFEQGLRELVRLDQDWVSDEPDAALYLRPFMIASEARLGLKASDEYLFLIVAAPAGRYYAEPLRVKVETGFIRAAPGGTGTTKCGGNYGGSLYPTQLARAEGFDQVLWTDGLRRENLEESGTMNLMFVIDGVLVTPALNGTILDGVTRDSLLTLARDAGMPVEERPVGWRELEQALQSGRRVEAFGAGTAAVVAPIRWIQIGDQGYPCYVGEDARMHELRRRLDALRRGEADDVYGWNTVVATR